MGDCTITSVRLLHTFTEIIFLVPAVSPLHTHSGPQRNVIRYNYGSTPLSTDSDILLHFRLNNHVPVARLRYGVTENCPLRTGHCVFPWYVPPWIIFILIYIASIFTSATGLSALLLSTGVPITDPKYFSQMSLEELAHVLRSDNNTAMPMLQERHQVWTQDSMLLFQILYISHLYKNI